MKYNQNRYAGIVVRKVRKVNAEYPQHRTQILATFEKHSETECNVCDVTVKTHNSSMISEKLTIA